MKLVGLIGGMSWESSIEYYRILNETVRERLGGLHSARCLLYSLDFEEIEQLQQQDHPLNEIAILVRTSFQMRSFEDRFVTLGLNYRVIGGPRFYERLEIRDALRTGLGIEIGRVRVGHVATIRRPGEVESS